ncbi:MAG: zinc metallopeptidase [Bacteroidales bacterium]|nr:zinc metallopeptidase [Bacteroidales bacterium]
MTMIWIITLAVMFASLLIQGKLQKRFAEYSQIPVQLTGAEIAQMMLRENGITDVKIMCISGELTDHYNPQNRTVNLSNDVYYGRSVSAAAVAAHECGHVLQHASGYSPLKLRTLLVPAVNFASNIVSWVLLAGVLLINVFPGLLWLAIALFALTTLFSIITLPVEINASSRAVAWLESAGVVSYETKPLAQDALKWAAYTYVIAAVGSLANLFYYISLFFRKN